MSVERSRDNRRRSMCRPYTYVGEYTTEDECIRIYGVSERKKFANDIPKVG